MPSEQEKFDAKLEQLAENDGAAGALSIPGCYEILSEYYNNDVLKELKEEREREEEREKHKEELRRNARIQSPEHTIEHYADTDWAMPEGLDHHGVLAWFATMKFLEELFEGDQSTGGCKAFYSPEAWRVRGEEHGRLSKLILCHDGGDLSYIVNEDHGQHEWVAQFTEALEAVGMYPQPCTSWYTAIYVR